MKFDLCFSTIIVDGPEGEATPGFGCSMVMNCFLAELCQLISAAHHLLRPISLNEMYLPEITREFQISFSRSSSARK